MTKTTFVVFAWLLNSSFDLSWGEIFRSMKIGGIGGGILGIGIVLLRLFKIKGL